ncbi:MAG TPA: thioredoxin family protein [Propionibacteriaceae bacterium]|nr:thioredoxin family protein [Propionibacteriaceae bacterium]HPZ50716.1 thioredoxin family protein [Propionibacteriaceae bacterium]
MDYSQVTCSTCRTRNQVPFVHHTAPECSQCKGFLPWIADAVDATFQAICDSSQVVVVVDLWATWSPPSRPLAAALERIAAERAGRMKLVKVDVEDARRVQSKLDARLIPTAVIFSQGKELGRQTGSPPLPQLRRWVDAALAQAAHANHEI